MSLIVAARFTTFAEAENAAKILFQNGFEEADVSVFFVNPPGMHNALRTGGDEYADRSAKASHGGLAIGAIMGAGVGIAVGATLVELLHVEPFIAAVAGGVGAYAGSLIGTLGTCLLYTSPSPRD